MQNQTQNQESHVLKARQIQSNQWKLEDRITQCEKQSEEAIGLSMNAAMTGQKQLRLAHAKIADLEKQVSIQDFSQKQQGQRLISLDSQIASSRNTSLVWGVMASIVVSLGISLITAPSNQTPSQSNTQGVSRAK